MAAKRKSRSTAKSPRSTAAVKPASGGGSGQPAATSAAGAGRRGGWPPAPKNGPVARGGVPYPAVGRGGSAATARRYAFRRS